MPYKRQLQGSVVWMGSYYVPNELLPVDARKKGANKTRVFEPATDAGYPNSDKGAAQLENRRKREIASGTYSYSAQGEHTAATWVVQWSDGRAARGKKTDRRRIEMHFSTFRDYGKMKLRDFRPHHFREWAKDGRALVAAGKIEAKTFRNVYGVLHTMFHDAVVHEKIAVNPCVISRADLPAKRTRKGRRYEDEESRELVWCLALPVDIRMLFCILSYTGERVGEACGHIWANWDPSSKPLGALALEWAYDRLPLKSSTDKERPRVIPVHPELASALEWWKREGWEAFYGRRPNADDPIIPNVFKKGHHTEKSIYHRSRDAFEEGKVHWKGHHACRHAFLTATRRLGANELYAERITHNAAGSTVDHYTHTEWAPLCAVVAVLPWKREAAQVVRMAVSGGDPGAGSRGDLATRTATDSPEGLKFSQIAEREKGFETFPSSGSAREIAGNGPPRLVRQPSLSAHFSDDGSFGAAGSQRHPDDIAFEEALAEHAERARVAELLGGGSR